MTEKRYSFNVHKMSIEKDGKFFAYTTVEHNKIVNELNALHEEKEELQRKYGKLLWTYNGLGCEYDDLKEENKQLRQILAKDKIMDWLREHSVWEQMPTDIKTYTTTSNKRNNEKRNCGLCKHFQIDGMFGMWCDINDTDYLHNNGNCQNYERK